MRFRILPLLALLVLMAACSGGSKAPEKTAEELISRSWKIKIFRVGQNAPPPEVVANASFTFMKDGRYEIMLGELERGAWRLSSDKKVLITVPDGKTTENHIDITTLTETQLIMDNATGANPTHFELVPM